MLMEKEDLHERSRSRERRFNEWRDRHFARLRDRYSSALEAFLDHRGLVTLAAVLLLATAVGLSFAVGVDFFPTVDTGMIGCITGDRRGRGSNRPSCRSTKWKERSVKWCPATSWR